MFIFDRLVNLHNSLDLSLSRSHPQKALRHVKLLKHLWIKKNFINSFYYILVIVLVSFVMKNNYYYIVIVILKIFLVIVLVIVN
jgi:hypothetical protein